MTKKSKNTKVLAVDFGAHNLKLVEVEYGPLGVVVKTFGVSPYHQNRKGQADLVATLEDLIRASHVTTKDTILVIPETDVSVFNFEDPAQNQIEHLKPGFLASNLVWATANTILALPRLVYNLYSEILKTAGLNIVGLQYVPASLARSVANIARAAILEFGAESSNWYVFDFGKLIQRNSIPYGGEALTRALELAHKWDRQKAENHKRSLIGDKQTWPKTTTKVVETYLERWWQDLIGGLAEQPSYIERLIVTGGGSRFLPMREFAFDRLGILPEDWSIPPTARVAETLRPYLEPQISLLANSLSHLLYF